jgi:hypothetical protein
VLSQLRARRLHRGLVQPFYHLLKHRQKRFAAATLKQRADDYVINKFCRHFRITETNPAHVLLGFGDWAKGNWGRGKKFEVCSKGKGLMSTFRARGFHVFYIREARTSKMCCDCQSRDAETHKFQRVPDPKVKAHLRTAATPTYLCHGLLQCSSCHGLFDRDCNGAKNILGLTLALVHELYNPPGASYGQKYRPEYLRTHPLAAPPAAAGAAADQSDDEDDEDD